MTSSLTAQLRLITNLLVGAFDSTLTYVTLTLLIRPVVTHDKTRSLKPHRPARHSGPRFSHRRELGSEWSIPPEGVTSSVIQEATPNERRTPGSCCHVNDHGIQGLEDTRISWLASPSGRPNPRGLCVCVDYTAARTDNS